MLCQHRALQMQFTVGQRAGFIHHNSVQIRQFLKKSGAADQNAVTRGNSNTSNCGGGCGKHQRTRTGRYQYRQHGVSITGDKPGRRRNQQNQHQILPGVTLEQTGDRRFGMLRFLHQRNHFSERSIRTGARDFNAKQSVEVDGTAKHIVTRAGFLWHRFAGDRCSVETGAT